MAGKRTQTDERARCQQLTFKCRVSRVDNTRMYTHEFDNSGVVVNTRGKLTVLPIQDFKLASPRNVYFMNCRAKTKLVVRMRLMLVISGSVQLAKLIFLSVF